MLMCHAATNKIYVLQSEIFAQCFAILILFNVAVHGGNGVNPLLHGFRCACPKKLNLGM